LTDLKLGAVGGGDDEKEDAGDKARLAQLISAEFSDHKEVSELEARLDSEHKLRNQFARRFEEANQKIQRLEAELVEGRGEIGRLETQVEQLGRGIALLEAQAQERAQVQAAAGDSVAREALDAAKDRLEDVMEECERLRNQVHELAPFRIQVQQREGTIRQLEAQLEESHLQADRMREARDALEAEDEEGRLEALRRKAEEAAEESESLREKVAELEGELEMRIAVLDGLREDFSGSEELRTRTEELRQENAQLREDLTITMSRLERVEDLDGLEHMINEALDRAEAAEHERDKAKGDIEEQLERALVAEERVEILQQKLEDGGQLGGGASPKWKAATGVLFAACVAMGMRLSTVTPPPPRLVVPPPTAPVIATGDGEGVNVDVLEWSALKALDHQAAGRQVPPPPRDATRGDLDEYQVMLARLARGDEIEPVLDRFHEVAEEAADRTRRTAHVLARVLKQRGETEGAARLAQRALAIDPKIADLHALMGYVHLAQDDLGAAEASFRRSIELDGQVARAYGGLAQVLELAGKEKEALEALAKALELDPSAPQYHFSKAMTLRLHGKWRKVANHLKTAIVYRSDDAYAHWYLAEALRQLGEEEEAEQHKAKALELGYVEEVPGGPPPELGAEPPGTEGAPVEGTADPGEAPPEEGSDRLPGQEPAPLPGMDAPLPGLPEEPPPPEQGTAPEVEEGTATPEGEPAATPEPSPEAAPEEAPVATSGSPEAAPEEAPVATSPASSPEPEPGEGATEAPPEGSEGGDAEGAAGEAEAGSTQGEAAPDEAESPPEDPYAGAEVSVTTTGS
jgi:tetratricopeptide (TPR) repeat protein